MKKNEQNEKKNFILGIAKIENFIQFVLDQNYWGKLFFINLFIHEEFRGKERDLPFNNLTKNST